MSYRRDRSRSRRYVPRRSVARHSPAQGWRSRRQTLRRRSQGPPWGVIGAALGIVIGVGVIAFLVVRALSPSEAAPTPTSIASLPPVTPSSTIVRLPTITAALSPTAAKPKLTPKPLSSPTPPISATSPPLNLPTLQQYMLTLINEDRTVAGLGPVSWDPTASLAAQSHAEEMANYSYVSHWNLNGHGPSYRYSQAGGLDAVQENVYVYWHRYVDGRPAPIEDWKDVIRQAQAELMESPGHRANILSPEHTDVGIGIAYNSESGNVHLTQLFVNHYIQLMPLPTRVTLGQQITLQGRVGSGISNPLLNLAYGPFPEPLGIAELNSTGAFVAQAQIYDTANLEVRQDGYLEHVLTFDNEGLPGLYYIRIWVNSEHGEVLANEIVVEVR